MRRRGGEVREDNGHGVLLRVSWYTIGVHVPLYRARATRCSPPLVEDTKSWKFEGKPGEKTGKKNERENGGKKGIRVAGKSRRFDDYRSLVLFPREGLIACNGTRV